MERKNFGSYEIDIVQALWEMLIRWKPMLLSGAVLALIFTGYKYISFINNSMDAETSGYGAAYYEKAASDMRENLPEKDIGDVEYLVNLIKGINGLRRYSRSAVAMKMDPYNARTLTLMYKVGDNSPEALASIKMIVESDDFYGAIGEALGYSNNDSESYISDVISFVTSSEEFDNNEISDSVAYISIMTLESWEDDVIVNAANDALSGAMNQHRLEFLGSSVSTSYSPSLEKIHYHVIAELTEGAAILDSGVETLNEDALLLLDYELRALGLNEKGYEIEDDVVNTAFFPTNIKNVITVFWGGVLLYIIALFISWISNPKAGRVMGLASMSSLPMLGVIQAGKKRNAFIYSPLILSLRGNMFVDKDSSVKNTVSALKFYASDIGEHDISFITIDDNSDFVLSVINEIGNAYNLVTGGYISITKLSLEERSRDVLYEDINALSGSAVMVAEYGITSLDSINIAYRLLNDRGIRIVGSICIE